MWGKGGNNFGGILSVELVGLRKEGGVFELFFVLFYSFRVGFLFFVVVCIR